MRALAMVLWSVALAGTAIPPAGAQEPPRILMMRSDGDSLWLASTGGLWRLNRERRVERVFRSADGLPSDVVSDIARTATGELWAATIYGAVRLSGDRFETMTRGLPSTDVTCLLAPRRGGLYAGTGRGIAEWQGDHWEARYETHQFGRDRVVAAREAPDGSLWFAKLGSLAIQRPDDSWQVLWRDPLNPDRAMPLPSTSVQALAFDADGRLWLASDAGLSLLAGMALQRHERWRPPPWGDDGLPSPRIWSMHRARDGSLWLSFGDGGEQGFVARRLTPSAPWERVPFGTPPARAVGYAFVEDDAGNLWLGTSAGLYRFDGEHFAPWPLDHD